MSRPAPVDPRERADRAARREAQRDEIFSARMAELQHADEIVTLDDIGAETEGNQVPVPGKAGIGQGGASNGIVVDGDAGLTAAALGAASSDSAGGLVRAVHSLG